MKRAFFKGFSVAEKYLRPESASLNSLGNFWRTFEMLLINCEINLQLMFMFFVPGIL